MDLLSLWEKMLANLKQVLPKEIFTNWFEGNIIPYSYSEEENLLILDTMTNFPRLRQQKIHGYPGNRRPGRHRPPDKGPADYEPGKEARSRKPARSRR